MFHYPKIDPIAFSIGPLHVHWYGLMYLFSFLIAWGLASLRARHSAGKWTMDQVADLIFYGALGVVIGGRLGYMFFYDLPRFMHHPLIVFQLWDGGMSFHGGLLGVVVALSYFAWKSQQNVWDMTDFVAPLVPIGLGLGRLGNFINGELWGRVTTMPWGMIYPNAGPLPRHPSELYEFALEGVVLFIILWFFSAKFRPRFAVSALFLFCYGCFRFALEFFRQPDPQKGFIAFGWLTEGQLLSIPMITIGLVALIIIYKRAGSPA